MYLKENITSNIPKCSNHLTQIYHIEQNLVAIVITKTLMKFCILVGSPSAITLKSTQETEQL